MSILVTGATGLVGSSVVKRLLRSGEFGDVIVWVRNVDKCKTMFGEDFEHLKCIVGDIRDFVECDYDIDYVVHCASVTTSKYMMDHPQETLDIAVEGTKNVLELSKRCGVKSFVYLSSMEMYGQIEESQNPVSEDKIGTLDLDNPRSCYPQSKRLCEEICRGYAEKFDVKIARLAQTFGPGIPKDDSRLFMQLARAVVENKNIVLHTQGLSTSNFCYLDDAVDAILLLLKKGKNGEAYNVCNDAETRTVSEIAEMVASKLSYGRIKVVYDIPKTNQYGYAADTKLRLCSNKLRALGWSPKVSMQEAYARLVEYIR